MIGAVIAMQSEAEILLDTMNICESLQIGNKKLFLGKAFQHDVAVCICGVGKVNAAIGTQILISKYNVEKILNFGVAGGLNAGTKLTEVYQIQAAVQFDFDLVQLNGTKMGTLDEYTENYLPLNTLSFPFEKKNLGTADRFNDAKADYDLLTKELNADIRDMEGGAIVQTALASKLPVYSIKAISDVAGNGSSTEQYLVNRSKALANLKNVLPTIFENL